MTEQHNPLWKGPLGASVPAAWSETAIVRELLTLQHQPVTLSRFVNELVQNLVLRQSNRTAKQRLAFLKTQLELLGATKELRVVLDDLQAFDLEREIRDLERQQKRNRGKLSWKTRMRSETGSERLTDLNTNVMCSK